MTLFRNLFMRFGFFLESSQGYGNAKDFAHNLLDNPGYSYKRYFDLEMILLVLVSVALVYSVGNPVKPWMLWMEDFAVTLFTVEYIARL